MIKLSSTLFPFLVVWFHTQALMLLCALNGCCTSTPCMAYHAVGPMDLYSIPPVNRKCNASCQIQGLSTHNSLYGHGHTGFSWNHTSINKPHPVQLRARDCAIATRIRCLAEKCPKISNQLYQPPFFNFRWRSFGKPSK